VVTEKLGVVRKFNVVRTFLTMSIFLIDWVTGVQLARVTEKLNGVTDGGRRKLNRVTDGATGKRSAGPHFYPYRTHISSHI